MTLPATQASSHAVAIPAARISTINPATGLSTDYLNHFAEAVMVLEMAVVTPECVHDLRGWRPKSYREHFATARFADRDAVIAAYEAAAPAVRDALDEVAETLNAVLLETRDVFLSPRAAPDAEALAQRAVAWLKPLLGRAAGIINGSRDTAGGSAQAAVDALFER